MFGPHVNRSGSHGHNIVDSIKNAIASANTNADFFVSVVAIFVGGPRMQKIIVSPEDSLELSKLPVKIIAHSAYCAHPWSGKPYATKFILDELNVCKAANIQGLVVHLPKAPIKNVINILPSLIVENNPKIFLETPAVSPKESYYETPEKLSKLFSAIREIDPELKNFGLCIDSAHLWTCGVDIRTYDDAENWLSRIDIPKSNIIFHLNDSERDIGVGPDTHAPLCLGKIWGAYKHNIKDSGLAAFVNYAVRNNIPTILERKKEETYNGDYLILRQLIV
jgi:endonuclease IV